MPNPNPHAAGRPRVAATRVLALALLAAPLIALAGRAAARDPVPDGYPHGAFQGECGDCHGARGWSPARFSRRFNHAKFGFALTGAHAAADCRACHLSLDFSVEKTRCESCHTDPHHAELGPDCARCHTSRSFIDRSAMVRAHQLTRFALTGSHMVVECESCHAPAAAGQMQFVNVNAECMACHRDDFLAAQDPDHAGSGFTECATCHSTISWQGGRFDHARVAGTPCANCHTADYDATANPNHAGAGFPLTCGTCHGTSTWLGATFDHDPWFPIESGAHNGRWNDCSDCHQTPDRYASFTCLSCHPHSDRGKTDGDHGGESGYRYESAACYSCHPRGRS